VDAGFTEAMFAIKAADLGWLGTHRRVRIPWSAQSDRFAAAIAQRAAEVGVDVEIGSSTLTIATGTAEAHQGADKLCAYIDGLSDALSDSYGNPPVEVGRKDLEQVIWAACSTSVLMSPAVMAAVDRLRRVLDVAAQRA